LRSAPAAEKFFDPACDWAPLEDFDYCTDVDRFDFVLRLKRVPDGRPELERVAAR
jgi:2-phosphosulfolactate phosphatase